MILFFSKPHAQKVRNVRADPRVMVAIGQPGLDFDAELMEATAELTASSPLELMPPSFAAKYSSRLTEAGLTIEGFVSVYSQPVRIWPERWLDWGGRGWVDRPGHPAFQPVMAAGALRG